MRSRTCKIYIRNLNKTFRYTFDIPLQIQEYYAYGQGVTLVV